MTETQPKIENHDQERAQVIDGTVMDHARHVESNGALACAISIAAAISSIDASRVAHWTGDSWSAECAIAKARSLLVGLIVDRDASP